MPYSCSTHPPSVSPPRTCLCRLVCHELCRRLCIGWCQTIFMTSSHSVTTVHLENSRHPSRTRMWHGRDHGALTLAAKHQSTVETHRRRAHNWIPLAARHVLVWGMMTSFTKDMKKNNSNMLKRDGFM